MTIETAYAALTDRIASALVAAEYLTAADQLKIDPEDLEEPTGDETDVQRVATVEKEETRPLRPILGRPAPRWVVERRVRVELLAFGPARGRRLEIDAAAVAALASLGVADPTLEGACERCDLVALDDGVTPPNGVTKTFTYALRVRSGDPLGASA